LLEEGNSTTVYLRINKFIGREKADAEVPDDEKAATNICSCISLPPKQGKKQKELSVISGRTSVLLDGKTVYLLGGGGFETGVPPTTISLKEPLDISFVDIRRNGKSVSSVACDNVSIHEFVVEVTFKGKPVPNGTPISLDVAGANPEKVILSEKTISTKKINDSILNPTGNVRSFASFSVQPFSGDSAFSVQIQAETNYDKRGDIERSMKACISLSYDPSQKTEEEGDNDTPSGVINSVFTPNLEVYDTTSNTWSKLAPMNHPRGSLTLDHYIDPYSDSLFAVGGINGNAILSYNEKYDVGENTWRQKASMNTPRFYHSSVQDLNYIYVFGGITSNGSDLEITRSVERYDIDRDVWENMPDMPIIDQNPYGLAMCANIRIGNKAYFIGGIRKIGNKGFIESMNDRILVFDLDTFEWAVGEKITGSDLFLYQRISPFVFASSDYEYVHIVGGSYVSSVSSDSSNQILNFHTTSCNFDTYTFSFVQDDFMYDQVPEPRYRGGYVNIGLDTYFMGGSSSVSQVSNLLERVDISTDPFEYASLKDMLTPKTSFGFSSDGSRYIYIAGGITSGRPEGFLQIKANVNPSKIRLDGKQTATLSLELRDEVGELPTKEVRVLVQGVLIFPKAKVQNSSTQEKSASSAERDALVYPVIFSSNDFKIKNGIGSTVLLPRSEDILKKVSEIKKTLGLQDNQIVGGGEQDSDTLKIKEGDIREPYSIKVRVTIIDDFYYGQTVLDVLENQKTTEPQVEIDGGSGTDGQSPPPPPPPPVAVESFEDCRSIDVTQKVPSGGSTGSTDNNTRDVENNQPIDQSLKESEGTVFSLNPSKSKQLPSPSIKYYSDIEWIPQVIVLVENGS
jgi:hypothetical protein